MEIQKEIYQDQESSDEDEANADEPMIEEEKEAPSEQKKEFRFADVFSRIEDVINNNEKVKIKDIIKAVKESCKDTNAEKLVKRITKKFHKMKIIKKF